jgi:hypothetical protein
VVALSAVETRRQRRAALVAELLGMQLDRQPSARAAAKIRRVWAGVKPMVSQKASTASIRPSRVQRGQPADQAASM